MPLGPESHLSAQRTELHTINHSGEEGNGSLRYINDIVQSVFYKLQELPLHCVQHPLTFEVHESREGTKLLNRSLPVSNRGKLLLVNLVLQQGKLSKGLFFYC